MLTKRIENENNLQEGAYLRGFHHEEEQYWYIEDCLFIGRSIENHIHTLNSFASRRHAKIIRCDQSFLLQDLQSENGTYVNQSRIREAILGEGDKIQIGEDVFYFSYQKPSEKEQIQTKSRSFQKTLSSLPNKAITDLPILIQADSGCGKEVFSRYIHQISRRARGPLVTINCSALSASVIESELFGHKRGSFTDASADRKGAFEEARGGTLVLDEIGDLPLDLQPKLLRALENKEIRPLGADRAIKTDARIIACTHKNLKQMVMEGTFRKDLFFRLNIIPFHLPRLKDRMVDFEDLLNAFCKEYRVAFSTEAIAILKKHDWPGNIRELKNVVCRASTLYNGIKRVEVKDIPYITENLGFSYKKMKSTSLSMIKEAELDLILKHLAINKGNQRKTAIDLGVPTSTLHDKVQKYQIDVKEIKLYNS